MDKFPKQAAAAASLFAELGAGRDFERRKMFGCDVGFVGGNMFAGVFADRLFFRVPKEEQASMKAAHAELRDFEPVAGRPMRDYLEISIGQGKRQLLRSLMDGAEEAARALPPKAKKPGARTARS